MTPPTPVRLFYSYSHKDEAFRDELEEHLSSLKRQGLIHTWHDRRISAGEEWQSAIDASLEAANLILFLVSAAFLASDYCYDKELKRALEKHEKGEARVIPIIVRPVDWSGAPFSKLQALPRDAKPVATWPNRDEAWADVARRIRRAIEELINRPSQEPPPSQEAEKPAQRVEPEKAEPKKAEPKKAAASESGAELGQALLKWGSFTTVRTLKGHTKAVHTVAFSSDGSILASGSGGEFFAGDCSVRLWRTSDGKLLRTLEGHKEPALWVAFLPDGKTLVSASVCNVWLWRVSDGARVPTLEKAAGDRFALSPDGTILAAKPLLPVPGRAIELWRVADGKHLRRIEFSEAEAEYGIGEIAFSPDGASLAAISLRTVFLRRVADGKTLRTFKTSEEEGGPLGVAFSPDGQILASAASSVWLWRVSDGAVLHRLKENSADPYDEKRATSVAFSPDGAILGSVHEDKAVRIWHVPSGKLLCSLKGHPKKVNSLAFSPDGAMLASASDDQTVRLWAG